MLTDLCSKIACPERSKIDLYEEDLKYNEDGEIESQITEKTLIPDYTPNLPILPWNDTRSLVKNITNSKNISDCLAGKGNLIIPITIPYGFQLQKTLAHPNSTLRSVIYIQQSTSAELFVSLDRHNVHVWRGLTRIKKIGTLGQGSSYRDENIKVTDEAIKKGVHGINKWKYIEKYRIYVVASNQLQLRILDSHFAEIFTTSSVKPVLSLVYVSKSEEIITGEVGYIRVWKLEYKSVRTQDEYKLLQRMLVELEEDEWAGFVSYDEIQNRIIAAVDNSVHMYCFLTGKKLGTLKEIHDMSITFIVYYDPLEYLITAAKDGEVKVWNSQNCLVWSFQEHFSQISGLALLEKGCQAAPKSMPLILTGSVNGKIRLLNFESGKCVYRLDTQHECLGLQFIKNDTFFHFSKKSIFVWKLNRYHSTFSFLRSQPIILKRISYANNSARILTTTSDGSIKLISPVTGNCLITGFPVHKDVSLIDVAYDIQNEKIYALNSSGDIAIYDCKANPCKVLNIWEFSQKDEKLNCITGVNLKNYNNSSNFFLMCGSKNGQFLSINLNDGKQEVLVQAHIAEVTMLIFDEKSSCLASVGKDMTIKFWKLRYMDVSPTSSLGNNITADNTANLGKQKQLNSLKSSLTSENKNLSKQKTNTTLNMMFELDVVINISHLNTIPKVVALNPFEKIVSIPFQNNIIMCSYEKNCTLEVPHKEKDKEKSSTGNITSISYLQSFDIWATSGTDGTIKIWKRENDGEALVIREIQFNEPIQAVCFCNKPGDLLVGLQDQISLVRLQDYFPVKLLRQSEKLKFIDDIIETPLMFDTQLDFWEFVYDNDLKKHGKIDFWHLQKKLKVEHKNDNSLNNEQVEYTLQNKQDLVKKRKNRRIFLETEHDLYKKQLNRLKGIVKDSPTRKEVLENNFLEETYDKSSNDMYLSLKASSNINLLPTGYLNLKSPTSTTYGSDSDDENRFVKEKKKTVVKSHFTGVKNEVTHHHYHTPKLHKFNGIPAFLLKPKAKVMEEVDKKTQEEKKKQLRRQLRMMGALPNSSVANQTIAPQRPKSNKKTNFTNRVQGSEGFSNNTVGNGKSGLGKDPKLSMNVIEALQKLRLKNAAFKAKDKNSKSDSMGSVYSVIEDEQDCFDESARPSSVEKTLAEKEFELPPINKGELETEIIDVLVGTNTGENENENKSNTEKVIAAEVKREEEDESERNSTSSIDEESEDLETLMSSTGPKRKTTILEFVPVNPKVISVCLNLNNKVKDFPSNSHTMTKFIAAADVHSSAFGGCQNDTRRKSVNLNFKKMNEKIRNQKRNQKNGLSEKKVYNNEMEEENSLLQNEEVNRVEFFLEPMVEINYETASKYIWDLIRCEKTASLYEAIFKLAYHHSNCNSENFEVTLKSLIKVLKSVIINGGEQEKCEAIKANLYLHRVFQRDIADPYNTLLEHQLVLMNDSSWKVRAQITSCILGYGVYSPEVIVAVICRLADQNRIVRKIALQNLTYFGVTTKLSLKNTMIMVGLLTANDDSKYSSTYLDRLLAQLKEARKWEIKSQLQQVKYWLGGLNMKTDAELLREAGYSDHLAELYSTLDEKEFHGEKSNIVDIVGGVFSEKKGFNSSTSNSHGKNYSLFLKKNQLLKNSKYMEFVDQLKNSPYRNGNSVKKKNSYKKGENVKSEIKRQVVQVNLTKELKKLRPFTAGSISAAGKNRPQSAIVADLIIPRARIIRTRGRSNTINCSYFM
ncbi:WD repeat-containing protein 87 [Lobulomyces angularis]|nr:WD repeat-containing protein 87 [Lobulomyces angularis]